MTPGSLVAGGAKRLERKLDLLISLTWRLGLIRRLRL